MSAEAFPCQRVQFKRSLEKQHCITYWRTALSSIIEKLKPYIGATSAPVMACEPVEKGAVRRYAQAIMYEDEIFDQSCERNERFGGAVAPPLFPTHMFRRAFGAPDPIQENATNPDFDGIVSATAAQGLPELIELKGYALLNGGSEIEFYKYPNHGDSVSLVSRYLDIYEKETSKGPIILVIIESDFFDSDGQLLVRTRRTQIRRK